MQLQISFSTFLILIFCQEICSAPGGELEKRIPEFCNMPADKGNCRVGLRIPRWYFNNSTAKCERFYYSGCGGNINNFSIKSLCQRACDKTYNMPW